uniref:Si:ch211-266i6.3 n=1 Tax=Cyprinus carpio TaxID=7962 RepID=A0A8C1ZQJ4_CYPCA
SFFLSIQSNKDNTKSHKNLVKGFQRPPSAVSAIRKHKPGMYKGRVVQSKIDCFRKPRADVKTPGKKGISKPDVTRPKPECPKVRSKSVSSLSASTKPRVNPAVSSRPKSVSDLQLSVTEKPVQVSVSHKRMPQNVPCTVTQAGARALPRSAPPATGRSTINKPVAPKKKEKMEKPKSATAEQKVCRPVTMYIDTFFFLSTVIFTLLLCNVQLVLKLCDKLEAMEMPSLCEDGVNVDKSDVVAEKRGEEQETDEVFEILGDEENSKSDIIKEDTEKPVIKDDDDDDDQEPQEKQLYTSEDDDSNEKMKSTTPKMAGASIVKYNVKTTPYLQRAPGSGSRRRVIIKDLKFLTPVRRSLRIQHKSFLLPGILNDHDTCVSSLAELMLREDANANAYIYRKNPALLEELPDQPEDSAVVLSSNIN